MTPPPSVPGEPALSGLARAGLGVLLLCSLLSLAGAAALQLDAARMAAPWFGMRSSLVLPAVLLFSVVALPLFGLGVFFGYPPLRAAGRVLPGLRVLGWEERWLFFLLATPVAVLMGAAAALWLNDATGAATTAGVAASLPLGLMVVLARRRRHQFEQRAVAQLLLAAPATDACWYSVDQGAVRGPLTAEQLAAVVCERWPGDTMVAGPTLPGWVLARQVPPFAQAPGAHLGRPMITRAGEESIGRWLERRLARFLRGGEPCTAKWFFGVTFWIVFSGGCMVGAGSELLLHASSAAMPRAVHAAGLVLTVFGVVLPPIVMVAATRERLRELGQDVRRGFHILIPGFNVYLWFRLILAMSASDKADAKRRY